jgi:hypothetical protein
MGEMSFTFKILIKKTPEENISAAGPRSRWEDSSKMGLKERVYKGVD